MPEIKQLSTITVQNSRNAIKRLYIKFIVSKKNFCFLSNCFQNVSFFSQSLIEKYYIKTQKVSLAKFFARIIESWTIIKIQVFK